MSITDQEILEYCLKDGKIIPQRCTLPVLKKRGWYDYLLHRFPDNVSETDKNRISETIYRMANGITVAPRCKICGATVSYTPGRGYADFCSKKCINSDEEVKRKNAANVSIALKNAYEKRGNEIKAKRKQTLEKYGASTSSPFSSKDISEKAVKTVRQKYGVDNVMSLPSFHNEAKNAARKRSVDLWKGRGYEIRFDENSVTVRNGCAVHGDITLSLRDFCNRMKEDRRKSSCICPICHPINEYSGEEKELSEFLDSLHLHYVRNDRNRIKPLELDFYFPEQGIAIELNGLIYHSELFKKDKLYHSRKTKLCKEKGIRLIHIWEDDFVRKRKIVESMLRILFGKAKNRISARECELKKIDSKSYKRFMEDNHLQGSVNAKYKYGLIYEGRIVSAMGFGELRISAGKHKEGGKCELYRYCTETDTVVRGGASKLFEYAKQDLREKGYNTVLTYAKNDHSDGGIYRKLGFTYDGETPPGYFWTDGRRRMGRFSARKSEIKEMGSQGMTEAEIMHSLKFYKCYDSGNARYSYKL